MVETNTRFHIVRLLLWLSFNSGKNGYRVYGMATCLCIILIFLLTSYFQVIGGWISFRFGSRRVIAISMFLSGIATIFIPLCSSWSWIALAVCRLLVGATHVSKVFKIRIQIDQYRYLNAPFMKPRQLNSIGTSNRLSTGTGFFKIEDRSFYA